MVIWKKCYILRVKNTTISVLFSYSAECHLFNSLTAKDREGRNSPFILCCLTDVSVPSVSLLRRPSSSSDMPPLSRPASHHAQNEGVWLLKEWEHLETMSPPNHWGSWGWWRGVDAYSGQGTYVLVCHRTSSGDRGSPNWYCLPVLMV